MKAKYHLIATLIACLLTGPTFATCQINISGATLFQDFFTAYASTNDYIDADHDGHKGFSVWDLDTPDQLARSDWKTNAQNPWIVMYRGVGSGNGLKELVNYHRATPGMEIGNPAELGLINRSKFSDLGVLLGDYNPANPGSAPVPINNIDIAVMDVPTTWFVQAGAQANAYWNRIPASDGYGMNPLKAWDQDQSNKLKTLVSTINSAIVLNTNTVSPDRNTVFDMPIAWVPIAFITNQGTGIENVTQQQLQHLFATGRLPSGENLVAATRDAGSGTRNGAMNSIGVDPSWARGDNIGKQLNDGSVTKSIGPKFQATNLGGSGIMEDAVQNSRLAVGYTGLMGASRAVADATSGRYEILNLKKIGATQYVRPTIENILDNCDTNLAWQIGGAETFATVGDPFSTNPEFDVDNPCAADYIKNIKISIDDFIDAPEDPCHNMPGEYMAINYTLVAGLQCVPSPQNPAVFVANTDSYNVQVNTFIKEKTVLDVPAYASKAIAGKVPLRAQLTTGAYSDGRTYLGTDDYYTDSSSAQIRAGATLSLRNRIVGDFLYDGKRDIADAQRMMLAFADPRAFEQNDNNGGDGYVIVEVIGDFNGDGNFDVNDIRYWADGLAICPATGELDRSLGFKLVDQFWTADLADTGNPAGNFFNTSLATGHPYMLGSGWSKADIAGNGRTGVGGTKVLTPGDSPVGADRIINALDIDYLHYVLRGGLEYSAFALVPPVNPNVHSGKLDWTNLDDAVWMDLSCDLNGDLIIDKADVDMLVKEILSTNYGDVNLDSVVNQTDKNIISAHIDVTAYGKGWADGDVNGDGYVTQADLDLANGAAISSSPDLNGDGIVDFGDFAIMAAHWLESL